MTNGEKIKEIFSDCFIVRRLSDNKIVHLVCTEEFLNSEYKEPTPKNDLEVDCIDRTELLKAMDTWDKFVCDADTKLVPYQDHYIPYIHYDDVIKCIKSMPSVTSQPCEDAVSRQAVLDLINADWKYEGLEIEINNLPSVTPQPRKGRWIGHREHCENLGVMPSGLGAYEWCSNCDCGIDVREWHRNNYNFCPNCGADMRGVE